MQLKIATLGRDAGAVPRREGEQRCARGEGQDRGENAKQRKPCPSQCPEWVWVSENLFSASSQWKLLASPPPPGTAFLPRFRGERPSPIQEVLLCMDGEWGAALPRWGAPPEDLPGVRGVRDDSGALPPQPEPEPGPGEHWSTHSSLLSPPPARRASSHPPCPAALPGSGRCWLSAGKGCRVTSGVNTACYSQIPLPGSARRQMARVCPPPRTGRL